MLPCLRKQINLILFTKNKKFKKGLKKRKDAIRKSQKLENFMIFELQTVASFCLGIENFRTNHVPMS